MATVLLTGSTGFVGANLAPMLDAAGHRLRCLVRAGNPAEALAHLDCERVEGSLEDEGILENALSGVDLVVHLAALVSFRKQDRDAMLRINVEGTRRLARLARIAGVRRMLHMSTISAVGYSDRPLVLDEDAPYNFGPLDIGYCDTKHAAEEAIREEVAAGLDAVIVNPPSMLGPNDRRKGRGSLVDVVARQKVPFLPPGGINVADVRDVCRGCLLALESGRTGERYILGGQNLTNPDLITTIARIAGVRPPRLRMPRWIAQAVAAGATAWETLRPMRGPVTAEILRISTRFMWYSSHKAEQELGYRAGPMEDGIRDAFAWMKSA